jgi:hypothetical protein
MNSYIILICILLVGFVVYYLIKDKIFDSELELEQLSPFTASVAYASGPGKAPLEIRQAPLYPPRTVSLSGPSAPSQAPDNQEVVVYNEPHATDPSQHYEESSEHPERLRHPERSYRAPPVNDNTSVAVKSGVAGHHLQTSSDNSQMYDTEMIQGGSEFMPGIFANDTYNDASFSSF